MGYEASLAYDPLAQRVLRWGGHNQGGGGEQNAELWAFDPVSARWELKEPNTSPPGVCCAQQNVFDLSQNRFVRFSAFSGSHGWQWFREIYLNNTSVWTYDYARNTWRDRRPVPAPRIAPLRAAAWDSNRQVCVVFGGEGSQDGTLVYDGHTNTWTRMQPAKQPAFRSGGNLAYDAAHKLHILFGSQFSDDPHTWAYDLRKNEWRDLQPERQPPTDCNDAVLAYDTVSQKIVAVVRAIDKRDGQEVIQGHLETWVFDASQNTWTPAKPTRELDGFRNRRRITVAVPQYNMLLLENYINPTDRVADAEREQQIWTYRLAEAKADPRPLPPSDVTVTTTASAATVRWQPSPSPGVTAYVIQRGTGEHPWQVDYQVIGRSNRDTTHFEDRDLKSGTIYHYFVQALSSEKLSADSLKVRTQPRVVEDMVVSVLSAKEVALTWMPPLEKDVIGYHIERAAVEVFSEDQVVRLKKDTPPLAEPSVGAVKAIGPFRRLTTAPVKEIRFTDTDVDLTKPPTVEKDPVYSHRFRADQLDAAGKPYRLGVFAYRIRAVNALGVESGPSPYFLTLPSAPQWLFSREEGEQCHLKWQPNLEQRLHGYRVYRMEGPKINGPGQPVTRLTAETIEATRYTDSKAGKETRRYWVVTVDALGQEGLPSAPTWHYRQFRSYYAPFVGEWHQ
jgi:hypothetical protein